MPPPVQPGPNGHVSTTSYQVYFISSVAKMADLGGESEIVQVYLIRRHDDATIDYNAQDFIDMNAESAIPEIGSLFSAWQPTSDHGCGWQALARCRGYIFETVNPGRCKVTVTWTTMAAGDPKTFATWTSPPNPAQMLLPSSIEYQASTRSEKYWRVGQASSPVPMTQPSNTLNASTADIGGTAVNYKEGIDVQVPQVRFRMRLMRDATIAPMKAQFAIVSGYLNMRNSHVFFDFINGSLLCEGVNMVKLENEYYEVIFDFLYDANYFHSQVPEMEPWGDVAITAGTPPTIKRVDWKRNIHAEVNFNNIFTASASDVALKAYLEQGYWLP